MTFSSGRFATRDALCSREWQASRLFFAIPARRYQALKRLGFNIIKLYIKVKIKSVEFARNFSRALGLPAHRVLLRKPRREVT
jgi:hypothetical protein